MEFAIGSLIIRTLNAIVWTIIVRRIFHNDQPVTRLARQMISIVIVSGLWCLAIGSLTQFGFPGDVARFIYTSYTAVALIVGLSLATEKEGP